MKVMQRSKASIIVFILSIVVLVFWLIAKSIDIYRYAVVGAIFEILWFLMLGLFFVLPILSFFLWRQEKFKLRSLYPYAILINVLSILLMIFLNS